MLSNQDGERSRLAENNEASASIDCILIHIDLVCNFTAASGMEDVNETTGHISDVLWDSVSYGRENRLSSDWDEQEGDGGQTTCTLPSTWNDTSSVCDGCRNASHWF